MTKRHPQVNWALFGLFSFALSLSAYVYYIYQYNYQEIMDSVDAKLLDAATSVHHILGNTYHDNINGPSHIDRKQYLNISKKLSEFSHNLGLEYVYAMILIDNQVHFTASSYTATDLENNKLSYFYDLYSEATHNNKTAFYSTEPVYEYSQDQWGEFKSIFVPYQSSDGRTYLTGADITIKNLNTRLAKSITQTLITACFFFFIAVLVAVIYISILKRNLSTDSTTGFANHIALENDLKNCHQLHLQIAVIWVNDLEDINSFYGCLIADNVMINLLQKFKSQIEKDVTLYRLCTNKIVLLTKELNNSKKLTHLINNFNLSTPILTDPFIYVTLCAGLAKGNKHFLLENAHIAAAQAKQSRHTSICYSDSLKEVKNKYQHNVKMAKDIREAFSEHMVLPYFQPIIEVATGKVVQYECLARIRYKDGTILEPREFLTVVNRSRMDGLLTRTMFKQCAEMFRKTNIKWSINLTAQDMLDPSLAEFLEGELKRYPTPSNITFELLETEALANFSEIKAFISMARAQGVKIVIDDFGTGYSNISNILKLEVDGIKLDGSLIKQLTSDQDIYLFIKHIASFSEQVNLQLIAEFVESKLVLDMLEEIGVKFVQGYYFSEPEEIPPKLEPEQLEFLKLKA
ncbi:EAL domain-containing protein [Pseudoalteromonas denitrificans]|uniref:Diguanylate cyclase/phosphodiesterase n=1 Tax=Pseudoalteromonas denitrificans DSM 6059 TaxID=1123010 RepID=A0A1I1NXM1_9GAMM|nr:GGDEF domain-containing protein [Pseudoalteromonas denitrificans]SFD02287.1 diguanylate cyclase/phosphodiesterase [Pseudoalteromonas denitrificans DSM 6059]